MADNYNGWVNYATWNAALWSDGGRMLFVLKKPIRSCRQAMRYVLPRRLTLQIHPRVHAWLWWNF